MTLRTGPIGSAVRLRSRTGRAAALPLVMLGALLGAASACVPPGLMDRPNGSGLLVGAAAALSGLTAAAPVALSYLVVTQLTGDAETGRLRDLYLQGVPLVMSRAGALLAVGRDWLLVAAAAVLAGAGVGLGDTLRVSGRLALGVWPASVVALIAIQLYVVLLALLWATVFRHAGAALLACTVLPLAALGSIPLIRDTWGLLVVQGTPLAPLWSRFSGDLAARYDLPMSGTTRLVVLASWTTLALIGSWFASRRNRPALRPPLQRRLDRPQGRPPSQSRIAPITEG